MTASSQEPLSQDLPPHAAGAQGGAIASPQTTWTSSGISALDPSTEDVAAPLYFLHIPKTAGTTLYVNMDDRFEIDDICPVRFISELIQLPSEAFQSYRLFRGHFGYSLHHFVDRPLRYVTVLRDPIERCISHYEDVRRVPNNFLHQRVNDNQMTFADFVRDSVANVTLNNLQARNLAFDWKAERMHGNIPLIKRGIAGTPLGLSDDELLEVALERLRGCVVVGVVERFDAMTALLSYRFGWYPIRPPRRLNQSARRMRRQELDEATLGLLEQLNRVDLALYAEATRLFDAQYAAMMADLKEQASPSPDGKPSLDLTSALIRHWGDRHAQQARFSSVLNVSMRRPIAGANWYGREGLEPGCTPFRWTGPDLTSTLYLPLQADGDLRLHLRIVRAIAPDVLQSLSLRVNDQPVPLTPLTQWDETVMLQGVVPAAAVSVPPRLTCLSLTVNRTDSMQTLAPHTPDQRQVGIAVSQVYVFPDGAIAPENHELNLFPIEDVHWVEVLDFVRSHLQPTEAIAAPKEFVQSFPNRFCDYQTLNTIKMTSQQPPNLPDWVIVAKHLTHTLDKTILRVMASTLRPVFANPVFFVLSQRPDLPTVSDFADPPWSEAAEFISQHLRPGEMLVAPEEFIYRFPEALSLRNDLDADLPDATWVVIHKGRLAGIDTSTLKRIVTDFRPVFANLVFVIFSSRPELRAMPLWARHGRPFWKAYYRRRWQQVISPPVLGGHSSSS